jgi:hypothetical protein
MINNDPILLELHPVCSDAQTVGLSYWQCIFDLDPIGELCLRFVLHIDNVPAGTTIDLNRWHIGITPDNHAFIADVTDYVTLEDNVLRLTVRQSGAFGAVWLERVPCEETS